MRAIFSCKMLMTRKPAAMVKATTMFAGTQSK